MSTPSLNQKKEIRHDDNKDINGRAKGPRKAADFKVTCVTSRNNMLNASYLTQNQRETLPLKLSDGELRCELQNPKKIAGLM